MANNPVVNTLSFTGSVAQSASIQAQGIAGGLTFLLPNTAPIQGNLMTVTSVNGNNVFLGWSAAQSLSNIPLSALAQSGATTGEFIAWNGSAWTPSSFVPGSGTVTSVALTGIAGIITVAGSPITTSGTLALSLATQTANTVFAGPTTGAPAAPTFRALVAADIGANTVTISAINSKRGNGGFVQLAASGTAGVAGDVVTFDANGNTVDSGTLLSSLAPLAGPTFTGTVSATTVIVSTNLRITGTLTDFGNNSGNVGTILTSTNTGIAWSSTTLAQLATLASPTFTGTVTTAAISATSVSASTFVAVTGNLDLSSGHGHIVQNTDIAGSITITNPATSNSFSFVGTYSAPPVAFVTPTSDPSVAGIVAYWVTTTTSAITVHVNTTPGTSITFNYLTLGN